MIDLFFLAGHTPTMSNKDGSIVPVRFDPEDFPGKKVYALYSDGTWAENNAGSVEDNMGISAVVAIMRQDLLAGLANSISAIGEQNVLQVLAGLGQSGGNPEEIVVHMTRKPYDFSVLCD